MKETTYIQRNQDRWRELERILEDTSGVDPHVLADAYVALTDDLAFSRSQYPTSDVTRYLNQLSVGLYTQLMKTKKERASRIKTFWLRDVPLAMYQVRWHVAVVAIALIGLTIVNYVVGLQTEDVARMILGDYYVDMSIHNIENGDPMGVYKQDSWMMFMHIAKNNVLVMLRSIALGVIPIVGILYVVSTHGVMLGSFHAIFARHNVVEEFLLTVYIHGALEMSLLVISAAAGLSISFGILSPGTLPRRIAFQQAIRRAARIGAGSVPFVLIAAFLESYVTKHTEMPELLSIVIIVSTLGSFWWYALIYPRRFTKGSL